MAKQKRGTRSILFDAPPILTAWASVAGKKESEGPLQAYFDYTNGDTYFGEKTWEKAECHMQEIALETLLQKAGKKKQDVDLVFSGDLLNQCISSSFSLRNTGLPALGLYADGYYFWDPLHAIAAKALLALLLVHVVAHWRWLAGFFKNGKGERHGK